MPLTYASATLQQSVAGNSTFRGTAFCNLFTPKTVISNFVTTRQIETPNSSKQCSHGTKKRRVHKKVFLNYVLIPWYPISYLTIASSVFFWALTGPYPRLRFGGACHTSILSHSPRHFIARVSLAKRPPLS